MSLGESLLGHLKKFPSPPYLFIGSGISRRYLNLEDWPGLLKKLCEIHELDHGYLSTEAAGDLPQLATLVAQTLQPKWWKEDRYKDSREKYAAIAVDKESALKIETVIYLKNAAKLTNDAGLLAELELFKKVVADGVVTTNWDNLIETLFPGQTVYVGQEGLIFSQIQGIAEIYKIHGTQDDPLSLVFTANDYSVFQQKNPYLASKLLTFFVENPVVFLGYSLADKNILRIIHSILDGLSNENVNKLADRLVFIQWDPKCENSRFERTILSHDGRSLPVYQGTTSSMAEVYEALGKVKRQIPAKLLRLLKQQVYQLVHSTDPADRLYVQDINDETPPDKIEFAMGVGLLAKLRDVGYVAISREILARDLVFNDQGLNAKTVVEKSLPELLKSAKYVPVLRYIRMAKSIDGFVPESMDGRVVKAASRTLDAYLKKSGSGKLIESAKKFKGDFLAFSEKDTIERTMAYWYYLPEIAFQVDQVENFLKEKFDLLINHHSPNIRTSFSRLISVYDYLKDAQEAAK